MNVCVSQETEEYPTSDEAIMYPGDGGEEGGEEEVQSQPDEIVDSEVEMEEEEDQPMVKKKPAKKEERDAQALRALGDFTEIEKAEGKKKATFHALF